MHGDQQLSNTANKVLHLSVTTWRTIFTWISWMFMVILIMSFIFIYTITNRNYNQVFYIDRNAPAVFTTSEKFLSIALDSSVIARGPNAYNFSNRRLLNMIKYMQPAYFRIGGTMGDRLHFNANTTVKNYYEYFDLLQDGDSCAYEDDYCDFVPRPNFTMTAQQWLMLNSVATEANLDIIFGLNALIRNADGSWNFENAKELIKFSADHNLEINWELGNEPDAFMHQFNYVVNATQLAKDFRTLRHILNINERYKYSILVGPDVTRPIEGHQKKEKFFESFISHAKPAINSITWHQYYFNGRTALPGDFVDVSILDLLATQIAAVKQIQSNAGASELPIWLGETSSAYGGGAKGMSDRFIASFMWLDKLGLSAQMGLDVVIRQSILQGNYALIGEDYTPSPDWWVSVLHKRLVGPVVVNSSFVSYPELRLYAQCTSNNVPYFQGSSVTIFGINIKNVFANIRIQGLSEKATRIYIYELTTDHLFSRNVFLNGVRLTLTEEGYLPPMEPKIVSINTDLEMQPYSVMFFVIPNAQVKACDNH